MRPAADANGRVPGPAPQTAADAHSWVAYGFAGAAGAARGAAGRSNQGWTSD